MISPSDSSTNIRISSALAGRSSQPSHPLGQWACDQGYKKVVSVAADYAFGYEVAGGFQKTFEDCGGKIIQKIWPPLGTKDFGPYIPTIKQDADAIFSLMVGPMSLQFPKQLRGAGYKKPIIGGGTSYDEFALPFMGDEVIGDVSALHYSAAIQTPKNEAFVKAYRAKYGKVPSYYSENNYTTAEWIDEAMKKAGGKWPGPEQFIKIMQGLTIDAVRGPVSMDEMRNPVENIYIKKVEKKQMFGYDKPELWNTVIKTYPNVSQFWTYGKEKFLAQPVYSRDFPPCKFWRITMKPPGLQKGAPAHLKFAGLRLTTETRMNGGDIPALELKGLCKSFGGLAGNLRRHPEDYAR